MRDTRQTKRDPHKQLPLAELKVLFSPSLALKKKLILVSHPACTASSQTSVAV
jgi:hypothetical protein